MQNKFNFLHSVNCFGLYGNKNPVTISELFIVTQKLVLDGLSTMQAKSRVNTGWHWDEWQKVSHQPEFALLIYFSITP